MQHAWLAARSVVAALRRRRLDLLVVTHADRDHHDGVPALLARVHVARAVLPARLAASELAVALRRAGVAPTVLRPGERLQPLPGVDLFAPAAGADANDNDQSLWVRLDVGGTTVLLSGDAEERGVAAALAAGFAAPSDVLVLPHHGRPNAAAAVLLARVRPRACLASASAADGETALGEVARRFGADVWATGVHGTITVDGLAATVSGSLGPRRLQPPVR
jgi:competence protein ComEC